MLIWMFQVTAEHHGVHINIILEHKVPGKQEVLDITSLANSSANMKIRFSFVSNNITTADGFYVDNIKLTNYSNVLTGVQGTGQIPKELRS